MGQKRVVRTSRRIRYILRTMLENGHDCIRAPFDNTRTAYVFGGAYRGGFGQWIRMRTFDAMREQGLVRPGKEANLYQLTALGRNTAELASLNAKLHTGRP